MLLSGNNGLKTSISDCFLTISERRACTLVAADRKMIRY